MRAFFQSATGKIGLKALYKKALCYLIILTGSFTCVERWPCCIKCQSWGVLHVWNFSDLNSVTVWLEHHQNLDACEWRPALFKPQIRSMLAKSLVSLWFLLCTEQCQKHTLQFVPLAAPAPPNSACSFPELWCLDKGCVEKPVPASLISDCCLWLMRLPEAGWIWRGTI